MCDCLLWCKPVNTSNNFVGDPEDCVIVEVNPKKQLKSRRRLFDSNTDSELVLLLRYTLAKRQYRLPQIYNKVGLR